MSDDQAATDDELRSRAREALRGKSVDQFLRMVDELIREPTSENLELLEGLLLEREGGTFSKHSFPRYVARAFLNIGVDGIRRLSSLIYRAPLHIYPFAILETLYDVSKGRLSRILFIDESNIKIHPTITSEMMQAARDVVLDVAILARNDEFYTGLLIGLMRHGDGLESSRDVLDLILQSGLAISDKTLDDFDALLIREEREEVYQVFLQQHAILIDHIAMETIAKQQFGNEFITDFVVRRLDDQYIVVEIEKPSTRIFTSRDDFAADLTHALGQVLDFQEWVESNIAYARTLLPHISSPTGLLIIGMRNSLSPRQIGKLNRLNVSLNGRVRIVCFDDILENGRALARNMRRRTNFPAKPGRDQRRAASIYEELETWERT